MGNTVGKFNFEIDINGAKVISQGTLGTFKNKDGVPLLTPGCLSDGEVDANIQLLKEDLDAVAKRMKAAIREQAKKPLF